jgi:UDP-glucose 4-epimerase
VKVLVTGLAGYIGSVTAERLLEQGHEVIGFDNLERGHPQAVDPRVRLLQGDLRDAEAIRRAMREVKPDAVMHFAAYALVPESMAAPELYFRNNVAGGINLAEAMLRAGVGRIVFSSTCATYGQPERVPITEDTPPRPANPYGESKLAFERILGWYEQLHGMQCVALRYFNACGASERFGEDHDPETHLIPLVLQVALGRRDRVRVCGADYATPDGTCLRDYVHVLDLAAAHILALSSATTGVFNLGTGRGYSVKEVVEAARRVTGHPLPAEVVLRRPGDPACLIAAADKARTVLKWQPRFTELEPIIESAWAWHRAHPAGYQR